MQAEVTRIEIPSPEEILQSRRNSLSDQVEPLVARCVAEANSWWTEGGHIDIPVTSVPPAIAQAVERRFWGTGWVVTYYPCRWWRKQPFFRMERSESCEAD